jgi:hypothetical protein
LDVTDQSRIETGHELASRWWTYNVSHATISRLSGRLVDHAPQDHAAILRVIYRQFCVPPVGGPPQSGAVADIAVSTTAGMTRLNRQSLQRLRSADS